MPPTSRADGRDTLSLTEKARRAQFVEAAIVTLAEVGYGKASFARIAGRAGANPALISYHFGTKKELMRQVVADVERDLERAVEDRVEQRATGHAGHVDMLRGFVEAFVDYAGRHPERLLAVGQIESAEGWAARERERSIDQISELLRGGQRSGEFRSFTPRLMSVALLAALEAVPDELRARPDSDVTVYADELATAFVRAVRDDRR